MMNSNKDHESELPSRKQRRHKHQMLAGAGAGLVTALVTCPLDVLKTRLQNQQRLSKSIDGYRGIMRASI